MSATHTPGPWVVSRSKMASDGAFDYAISSDDTKVLAEAFGRDAKGGWPNAEANAALIAASPDMYAALKAAEELSNTGLMFADEELLDRVRDLRHAAISKAEAKP